MRCGLHRPSPLTRQDRVRRTQHDAYSVVDFPPFFGEFSTAAKQNTNTQPAQRLIVVMTGRTIIVFGGIFGKRLKVFWRASLWARAYGRAARA
jgi:hypothetical protein